MRTEQLERSPYIGLASATCKICGGSGWNEAQRVCACCYRAICDEVIRAYRYFTVTVGQSIRSLQWDALPGPRGRSTRGSKSLRQIEFCADVESCARRALSPGDHAIFRLHFVAGLKESQCCAKLHLKPHEYNYRMLSVIKQKLGQTFVNLRPCALHPVDFYLHGATRQVDIRPFPAHEEARRYIPLRPPLGKPQPEPASVVVMPVRAVSVVPFNPADSEDMTNWLRRQFRNRTPFSTLANRLTGWRIPVPDGGSFWRTSDVKYYLLGKVAPRQRRAA